MTWSDWLGLTDHHERYLTRGLQALLLGLVGFGVVTAKQGVIVAAGLALGVTLIPALLRREYGYSMNAGLVLWLTIAMVLHAIGSIGLYDQHQWYDEVTHTASATVVAGVGYAAFRALELHSEAIDVPAAFRGVFIVVFVLAAGMVWGVLEFVLGGLAPVYGIDDIVTDLMFNTIGAILVAVWGTGYVSGLIVFFGKRLRST